MKKTILTLSVAALSASPAAAHVTSASGTGTSGPILTTSPQTLAKGDVAIGLSYERFDLDSFSDEFLEDVALAGFEEVHNTDRIEIPSLNLAYGISDRLEIGLIVPLLSRRGIAEGELEAPGVAEVEVLGNSFGFGDITAIARYHALTENHSFADIGVSVGVKLPTGETGELEDDGSPFEAEFQPGSGSFDFLLGGAIGKSFGNFALNADVQYTLVGEGTQDTDLGDSFTANAAISYGWELGNDSNFTLAGELIFQDQQRERIGAEIDVNSGGTQWFIAPGFRYQSGKGWGLFGSIALPLSERLNGIQNDTDFRLHTGISYSF